MPRPATRRRALVAVVAAALTVGGAACSTDSADDSSEIEPSPQGELDDVGGDGPTESIPIDDGDMGDVPRDEEVGGGERDARPMGG